MAVIKAVLIIEFMAFKKVRGSSGTAITARIMLYCSQSQKILL